MGCGVGNEVNVDIVPADGSGISTYAQPVKIDRTSRTLSAEVPSASLRSEVSSARQAAVTAGQGVRHDFRLAKLPSSTSRRVGATAQLPPNCRLISDLGTYWVKVGQTSATASGVASQDFVYSEGATTTYDAAFSVTGAVGTYTKSGSTTTSATAEIGFPAQKGSGTKHLSTKWSFGKVACTYGSSQIASYSIRALDLAGGNLLQSVGNPSAPSKYCVPYVKGGYMSKSTTTAVTYSDGISVSYLGSGFHLASRTGFSGNASQRFTFLKSGQLCGVGAVPAGTPYQLVVKP